LRVPEEEILEVCPSFQFDRAAAYETGRG